MTGSRPRRVDAHQHFWRLARGDYGWLTPAKGPIYRDFGPADLTPLLARAGIDATVLVQAAPTVDETRFLLELARTTPVVAGVVGWAPLDAPDAPDVVAALARTPALKGLRPMLHDIPDIDWVLRPEVARGLRAIAAADLTFDALVRTPHLPNLRRLLERHPDLRVVIDHGAKPEIVQGAREPWATHMAGLARETRAWVKLSGLVTEDGAEWSVERLRPYVDHLLECFGARAHDLRERLAGGDPSRLLRGVGCRRRRAPRRARAGRPRPRPRPQRDRLLSARPERRVTGAGPGRRLAGKSALVTGAGRRRGLGFAIAARLAAEGARVVLADLAERAGELEDGAARIRAQGGEAVGLCADITSEPEVDALFARAVEAAGRLDVVVNNAGVIVAKLIVGRPQLPTSS